jgi:formylglycine-generating enzyme required for sulfatase activity
MILVCFLAVIACSAAFAGAEAGNYRQGQAGAWLLAEGTSQAEESVNSVGIKMVKIGPGSFEMGSTLGRDYWDEQPVHKVTISR